MNKKNFNLFIDNYDVIRRTLNQLFIYGCYDSSTGAARQKISDRKYSDELKRIRYFWTGKVGSKRHEGKKINFFPFNLHADDENYLFRSYQIHTFKAQDINLYVFLMQLLSDSEPHVITELIDDIQFYFFSESNSLAGVFYPMVKRKLEEMTDVGLLVRGDRNASYRLAPDTLEALDSQELIRLYRVLFFYRDILPLAAVGYQVQQIIGDYLRLVRGESDLPDTCFHFEDIFFWNVLNDDVLYKIIVAIEQHRRIAFRLLEFDEVMTDVTPIKIIADCQYGRQYLMGRSADGIFIRRLDHMVDVRLLDKIDQCKSEYESSDAEKLYRYIWNASLPAAPATPCKVEADFFIADDERHFLKRLEAEKRFGTLEKLGENHYLFSIELLDPNEIIPWLRSFGHVVSVRQSDRHDLREKIRREWGAALENYTKPIARIDRDFGSEIFCDAPPLPPVKCKQPKLFNEFRNVFYRAVTFIFNEILIDNARFNGQTLSSRLGELALNLDKKSALNDPLIKKMIGCGDEIKTFALFREENGVLMPRYKGDEFSIPDIPIRLLSIEKRWLKTMLRAPLATELLGRTLTGKLKTIFDDVRPFRFEEVFIRNGRRTDGDNFSDRRLAENISLLMKAIEEKKCLRYSQTANNGKKYRGVCLPLKIIFSPYLQKFQVRALVGNADCEQCAPKLINVLNFNRLELLNSDDSFLQSAAYRHIDRQHLLKLRIFPVRGFNDIERCFMLFGNNPKEGWYDRKHNVWHLAIYYYSFEQRALRRKLLSLGKSLVIDEPSELRAAFTDELQSCNSPLLYK